MKEFEITQSEIENKIDNPLFQFSLRKAISLLSEKEYFLQESMHVLEVCNFANQLLDHEGVEDKNTRDIVLIASAIHDNGRYLGGIFLQRHCEVDLLSLDPFISPEISPKDRIRILNCVQRHSTSSKTPPGNLEEKIVFDADNLTVFTEFGYKRWFFKAEDWGHVHDLTHADQSLRDLFEQAKRGKLFYLNSSLTILDNTFYSKICNL